MPADARKRPAAKPDYHLLIREMIVSGAVLPNERLIEVDLATRFGTNRANIRIALGRLDQEGLITVERNLGARVRVVDKAEAVQIFEARGALEALVAEHAARNATAAQCRRMHLFLDRMDDALRADELADFSERSAELRALIWDASRHEVARQLLSSTNYQLVRFRYRTIYLPNRATEAFGHLKAVVEAICRGDPQAAVAAMATYSTGAVASLRTVIRRH